MRGSNILFALAVGGSLLAAAPASAQFYLQPANLAGEPVTGSEPGITGPALAGATPAELRAALVWNLRAALNVAALQCHFEPTLMTLDNYNMLLKNHSAELASAYDTLEKYFIRSAPNRRAGQLEVDRFGTRVYSSYSTISAQRSFCQTASSLGRDALFYKRGDVGALAQNRLRELRASLQPWGEQYRAGGNQPHLFNMRFHKLPPFSDSRCWKKDEYNQKRCGPLS